MHPPLCFFPFSTINSDGSCNNTEITPYDADAATGLIPSANLVDTPRADGDTCFAMALMLCYNQFAVTPTTDTTLRTFVSSTPITFPTGMAGGLGRKGGKSSSSKRMACQTPRQQRLSIPPACTLLPDSLRHEQPEQKRISFRHGLQHPKQHHGSEPNQYAVTQLQPLTPRSRNPFRRIDRIRSRGLPEPTPVQLCPPCKPCSTTREPRACLHSTADESGHYRNRCSYVGESGFRLHKHHGKRSEILRR